MIVALTILAIICCGIAYYLGKSVESAKYILETRKKNETISDKNRLIHHLFEESHELTAKYKKLEASVSQMLAASQEAKEREVEDPLLPFSPKVSNMENKPKSYSSEQCLGFDQKVKILMSENSSIRKDNCELQVRYENLESEFEKLKYEKQEIEQSNHDLQDKLDTTQRQNDYAIKLLEEKKQTYPFLAKLYEEFISQKNERIAELMCEKARPAISSANKVREIAKEASSWIYKAKLYQHQLDFYEELFPWLEEFKELPPMDAYDMVRGQDDSDEYSNYRKYLSPEEYNNLSQAEKNQLALERYKKRPKSNWDAGIEFERYIGYKYESHGFDVDYCGATQGLEDMGRDIIAVKDSKVFVIQCKRWSADKTIHEKHIFQLYGTTILYKIDHPSMNIVPLFVTTTKLSDTAARVAEMLQIKIVKDYPLDDYPMIKCNINKGNKIYHMPFDQQYDNVKIKPGTGECYVSTVEEAERLGFRHAYKWNPD